MREYENASKQRVPFRSGPIFSRTEFPFVPHDGTAKLLFTTLCPAFGPTPVTKLFFMIYRARSGYIFSEDNTRMPKPFVLGVEIEEGSLGKVMRRINALPGVVNIIMSFDAKPKGAAKLNGSAHPRGTYETTGREAVTAILNGKPPMTVRQLRDAFTAQGRSPASIASVVHAMKASGELKLTDDGYTLTKLMRDRLRHRGGKAKKK